MKCQKSVKNVYLNFPEPNVMSSDFFLCPNSPKHRDSSFIIINNTEKQQILTLKSPNQQFFLIIYLRNDWND